jgi:predicted amidohydrolase YtcJ
MSGCLEGYNAIAQQLLEGIDHKELLEKLKDETSIQPSALRESKSWVFHSTSNPTPIITMQNGKFSAAPAMAIKDGKVAAIGTYEAVKAAAGPLAEEKDLESQCIVPGFVEPHLHIILSAMLKGFLINCDPLNQETCGTFDGTINFIKCKSKDLKRESQWLLGYGYDPSRLCLGEDKKFQDLTFDVFTKANLNEHPIFIINASGHLAYANQKAFKIAGVDNTTCNPPDGRYVKDKEGNLTGVLLEPSSYVKFLKKALPKDLLKTPKIVAGLHEVVKEWSEKGFTTVFDAGVGQTGVLDASVLYTLSLVAPLRIAGAAANLKAGDACDIVGHGNMPPHGATALKIKTIKLWMDGSTQGFTAALEKQYNTDVLPCYFSKDPNGWARWSVGSTCPIDTGSGCIADEMQAWAAKGYQLMVHVNGDCAADVVLDAFDQVVAAVPPKPPIMHRLEHFTVTTLEQVKRAKKLNLGVSHTIGHVKYWGCTLRKHILDTDRADRIDPVKDDLDNDLVYSFNSDSPVSQADALSFVSTAATRLMYKDDKVLGQNQTVSVEAALAGVTINPAKQVMLDSEIGSLEKGKNADFVILSQDISSPTVDAKDIGSTWVKETWFKGVKKYP